ncbi:MAG TPA: hypothetical protein VIG06_12865 [Kofleriaceae bacterium]
MRWWSAALALALALALAAACGDNTGAGEGPDCTSCGPDASAGQPDAGPPGAFCDDGNPCTADTVEGDGCRFDAVADGALCEDGDLCTLGDRCQAGECAGGERAEGELALLGRLDDLAGRRIPLGPNRFAAITVEDLFRGRIQVFSRSGEGFTTLSVWRGDLTLVVLGDEDVLADAVPGSGIVAVTASGERLLRLFSASDDEVAPRGSVELSGQVISLSARDDRVWLCTGNFIVGYQVTLVDIADPDAPVEVGSMPLGAVQCGSTAISQSGDRVYFNTADGVRFVDASPLDTGGDPTLSEIIAPTAGVSISGSHLLLLNPTGVDILDEPSLDEVVTVPVGRPRAAALFGERLLVEGVRSAGGGNSDVFVAWYDALGGGAPSLLDEAVVHSYIGQPAGSTFRSASDGSTLLTRTRAYDIRPDRLDEIRVPSLLPLRSLARTDSGLRAYHAYGAAAIDVSDPSAPAFVAGGAFAEPRPILTISVDDSLPTPTFASGLGQGLEDPTRVALDPSNPYYPDPLPVYRWTLDASADLVAEDEFSLAHHGTSQLLAAGDFLYRVPRPTASDLTSAFQGYWLPALRGGAAATPVFDLVIPAGSDARRGFDVDPRARIAVVSSDDPATLIPALFFFDLSTSPPTPIATLPTDSLFSQLRIAGTRVIGVGIRDFVLFDLERGEVARIPAETYDRQLLAFDGTTAYFADLYIEPGTTIYSIAAVPFADPASLVRLELSSIPRSLVPIDGGLALGLDTQLLTIHPHCP